MTKKKLPINRLQIMALNNFEAMTRDDEIRRIDVGPIFFAELKKMIHNNELINGQLNGLPGSGKSVVMLALVFFVNNILKKQTTIDHILPNQIVYAQVMKQIVDRLDECIGVDEYDELGDTGYNATTEQSALNHYSDLHRAHYVHKWACAPKDTLDKNAFLFLEILGANKQERYTRCLLYYKLFVRGQEHLQLVGHVDIDVSAVLDHPMYQEYEKRKMHRLQLFSKQGIVHERHIFSGKLILQAFKELRPLARFTQLTKESCKIKVEMVARQQKVMNSILTTMATAGDLLALLTYVKEQERIRQRIHNLKKKLGKMPGSENEARMAIAEFTQHLEQVCQEEEEMIKYWEEAAGLESLYISNLGKI